METSQKSEQAIKLETFLHLEKLGRPSADGIETFYWNRNFGVALICIIIQEYFV